MTILPATFCAAPFYQINITNDGKARLCCRTHDSIMEGNRPLSLHSETFEQIWNSNYMRTVRGVMLAGEKVDACVGCYATEADGGKSLRHILNANAKSMLDAADDSAILAQAQTVVGEYAGIAPSPAALHLWLGNLCNLKCRMCSPMFSSQIAADSVHSKWRETVPRSETLLPAYRDGVDYTGFGNLVKQGEMALREVSMEGATIALPGNGEPIASIEISGSKHPLLPCRLSLGAGNRWLAKKWLLRTHWKMTVRPDYTCKSPTPIRLSLQFLGFRQRIGIDALTITTITPGSKEQPREIISRIPGNPYWAKDESIVFGEIFVHPRRLRWLNFSGGEPLINPVFPVILERLVESGHAEHIGLYITSNGTVHSQRLSELLKQFRFAHIGFSIDGIGALQEYIRPPLKWGIVRRNLVAFLEENVPVSVRPTVQAYNIFGLLDLVRWCDRHQVPFVLDNILYSPASLSLDMLPQVVIDGALGDWLEYLDTECAEDNRWHVETVIAALRRPRPEPAEMAVLQDEFIRFTNDLDRGCDQSFETVSPILHRHLITAGFDFRGKHRF